MPYRLSQDKLCVQKQAPQGHWITQKCYKNTDDARAYLGALQANVEDAKAMETTQEQTETQANVKMYWPEKLSQSEVNYESYMVRRNPVNQACANCRWFAAPMDCFIVKCEPLPILPTGWCDRWEEMPAREESMMEEMEEMMEDSEEYDVGMMSRYGVDVARPVVDVIEKRGLLRRDKVETSFKILPSGHWLACYTNNFKDDDDEILKAKAHRDYVARIKGGFTEMPGLWLGHIEGTEHGKALYVDYIETDGVITVFGIGTFTDTLAGKSARRYYEKAKPGEISLSHGFLFPKWAKKNGEYEVYNTFEISTLKRGQEANAFTNFSVEIKDKTMPLQESQIEHIKDVFGEAAPEIIKRVEAKGKADKSLADLGAKYKGFTDFANVNGAEDTDSAANKGRDASTIEAFKALIPDLLEDNAAQLALLEAMDKRLDAAEKAKHEALEAKVASLENEVKQMRTALNMPGQAASESSSNVVATTDKGRLVPTSTQFTPAELAEIERVLNAKKTGQGASTPEQIIFGGQ